MDILNQEWIELDKKRRAFFRANAPKNIRSLVMTKAWEIYKKALANKVGWDTPSFRWSLSYAWKTIKKEIYSEEIKKNVRMFFDYDAPVKRSNI